MLISPTIILFIFLANSLLIHVRAANILGLMGVLAPSHNMWNSVLMHRLAELGHNVTVLSVDVPKTNENLPKNLHYIHLEKGYLKTGGSATVFLGLGYYQYIPIYYNRKLAEMQRILTSKGMKTLLDYPKDFKFDLIVYDFTIGPYLLGFVDKFNYPPLVGISAFHNPPITLDLMSNHYFPAYIPYHSTSYSTEMNFWERLDNTLLFIVDTAYRRLIFPPTRDAIVRPYFRNDMPPLGDIARHTAIALVNSHPATNYVEPIPQNVIEVGGMQILDPKPLPTDIEAFLNKTHNGVVYISFGTNMKSSDFTEDRKHVIVNATIDLPQYNFLWKFDENYLNEKMPENILVRSLFPQRDILAHPKVKAFVTHCGGLSSQEAMWRGVPMVGVPLFYDQHRNLRQSMLAGIAVKLDFRTMSKEDLVQAIRTVIEDPTMRNKIRNKAAQFSDRPMRPLDTAVWWVEFLLRNPKPDHLKSHAEMLNIFQANSLDCLLFILAGCLLVVFVIVKVVLFISRRLWMMQNTNKLKSISDPKNFSDYVHYVDDYKVKFN